MNVSEVRRLASSWIESNRSAWPGLVAAHMVGGITAMPPDAQFPASKDVDLHLVFSPDSPMLRPTGPFLNIIEAVQDGVMLEAGIKSAADYESAETVLGNPEIAHHLTTDCILYDPAGMLAQLQVPVRAGYAVPQWIKARVEFEWAGLNGAMAMLPMARAAVATGSLEANLIGYSFTYVTAALAVARLQPPAIGSRMPVRLRLHLAELGRSDLYDEFLSVVGVDQTTPGDVSNYLREGAALFDLAVQHRKTPHPFGHKLYPHLRGYFVDNAQAMIDEGNFREALCWTTPYFCSSADLMLADGPDDLKPGVLDQLGAFLRHLGMSTPEGRAQKVARAERLHAACFELADKIVAGYPA